MLIIRLCEPLTELYFRWKKATKQNRPTLFVVALQSSSNNCQRTFNNELTAGPLCIFVTEGLSNDISAAIFSFTFGNVERVWKDSQDANGRLLFGLTMLSTLESR